MKDPNAPWVWAVVAALLFLIVPYFLAGSATLVWGLPVWFLVSSAAAVVLAVVTAVVISRRWSLASRTLGEKEED